MDPRRMAEDIQHLLSELIGALGSDVGDKGHRSIFAFGPNVIDVRRREVKADGHIVHLTPRQYALLLALAEKQGAPVSRSELRTLVWNDTISERSRAIDQTILELRQKLEREPGSPEFLRKASKFGYRLEGRWLR